VALPAVLELLEDCDVVDELERREMRIEPEVLGEVAEAPADLEALARVTRIEEPSRRTRPCDGDMRVARMRMRVVLPAPLGPRRPVMPEPRSRLTPSSARNDP
jgi:hypothetical protein